MPKKACRIYYSREYYGNHTDKLRAGEECPGPEQKRAGATSLGELFRVIHCHSCHSSKTLFLCVTFTYLCIDCLCFVPSLSLASAAVGEFFLRFLRNVSFLCRVTTWWLAVCHRAMFGASVCICNDRFTFSQSFRPCPKMWTFAEFLWCPPISPNPNSPNLRLGLGLGMGLGIGLGVGNGIGRIGIGRNG